MARKPVRLPFKSMLPTVTSSFGFLGRLNQVYLRDVALATKIVASWSWFPALIVIWFLGWSGWQGSESQLYFGLKSRSESMKWPIHLLSSTTNFAIKSTSSAEPRQRKLNCWYCSYGNGFASSGHTSCGSRRQARDYCLTSLSSDHHALVRAATATKWTESVCSQPGHFGYLHTLSWLWFHLASWAWVQSTKWH